MATTPTALNSYYQALYDAQLPQVTLAAQQAQQQRGMFYSGNAVDMQTKAAADLMSKLLAQQAADTEQQKLQQAQINQAQSAQENQSKATARATNMGLIGTGLGTAATLGGLWYMNGKNGVGGGMKNTMMVDGQPVTVNGDGTYTPMEATGVGGSVVPKGAGGVMPSSNSYDAIANGGGGPPAVGGSAMSSAPTSLDQLGGVGPTPSPAAMMSTQPGGLPAAGFASAAPAAAATPAAAPVASMWNDPLQAAGGIGMGLAGGAGGYLAANQVNGGGKNTALASGLGGLAGGATGALMSSGNPYAAGAGALLGSFGGGLLGNLFK